MASANAWVPAPTLKEAMALKKKGMYHQAAVAVLKGQLEEDAKTAGTRDASTLLQQILSALEIDPYIALHLERSCEESAIKKAYHKCALKYHPDKIKSGGKANGALFQVIQAAYTTLSDPKLRREHDAKARGGGGAGSGKSHARAPRPPPARRHSAAPQPPPRPTSYANAAKGGGARRPSAPFQPQRPSAAPRAGGPRGADNPFGRFYSEFRDAANDYSDHFGAYARAAGAAGGAENHNPNSAYSRAHAAPKPPPSAPPQVPKGFSGTAKLRATLRTHDSVTLEWAACPNAAGYQLHWRARHCGWAASTNLVTGTSCRKRNLGPGTEYDFRLRPVMRSGAPLGDFSNTCSTATTPLGCPPEKERKKHKQDGSDDPMRKGVETLKRESQDNLRQMRKDRFERMAKLAEERERARQNVRDRQQQQEQQQEQQQHAKPPPAPASNASKPSDKSTADKKEVKRRRRQEQAERRERMVREKREAEERQKAKERMKAAEDGEDDEVGAPEDDKKAKRRRRKSKGGGVKKNLSESWAWKRGDEEAKEAKEVEWCCGVCKRQNRAEDQRCFTCFTTKDYDAGNLGNLGKGKAQKQQAKKGALPTIERFHLRGSVALSLLRRCATCATPPNESTPALTA